jgi:hypothetical protein
MIYDDVIGVKGGKQAFEFFGEAFELPYAATMGDISIYSCLHSAYRPQNQHPQVRLGCVILYFLLFQCIAT